MALKAIVTGGAGFIGSHIARRLVEQGAEVTIIDDLSTGNLNSIKDIAGKVNFIQGRSGLISKLPAVDVVFHEGIPSSTPIYRNDRKKVAEAIDDFIEVLEYCTKSNAKLVFASSSSIYNGHQPPHREDMLPLVKDYYTEARYSMERLAQLYHDMSGLSYVALRYFSVYGYREEHKKGFANMISQALWKALLGNELTIYGDGSQRRDFVFVEDVVDANLQAYERSVEGVYNVGTGNSLSFNEMIEKVEEVTGKKPKVNYVPNPLKNYVDVVEADTEKMKGELGFVPKTKLEEGIQAAYAHYSSLPKEEIPNIP